jgi:hypothetical protein
MPVSFCAARARLLGGWEWKGAETYRIRRRRTRCTAASFSPAVASLRRLPSVVPRDRVFAALLGPVVQELSALDWSGHSPPRFTLPHSSLCPAQVLLCYMIGVLPSGPLIFPIPLARETHSPDVPGVANRRPKGRRTDVPDPEKIQQDRHCTAAFFRIFSPPLISRARCASVHLCLLASLRFKRHDTLSDAASALDLQSVRLVAFPTPIRVDCLLSVTGQPIQARGSAGSSLSTSPRDATTPPSAADVRLGKCTRLVWLTAIPAATTAPCSASPSCLSVPCSARLLPSVSLPVVLGSRLA